MLDIKNTENIAFLFSIIGGLGTFFSLVWMKVIKPAIKLLNDHESVSKSIETIKKELTTNGGNSLKDTVIDLRSIINRMEKRQKIIEQRTKAALHYNDVALFEIDDHGRLTWTNNNFYELTQDVVNSVEGYDWLNYIIEDDREDLFIELKSCLEMGRKLVKNVKTIDDKNIRVMGFPYRISDQEHGGFLVSISTLKEI
jgi:transcriptional regulator with PAS, ATPase and Fis domain